MFFTTRRESRFQATTSWGSLGQFKKRNLLRIQKKSRQILTEMAAFSVSLRLPIYGQFCTKITSSWIVNAVVCDHTDFISIIENIETEKAQIKWAIEDTV